MHVCKERPNSVTHLMKKNLLLLFSAFIFASASAQQQILLITESFENGTANFNSDSGGVGTNTGNNAWIINNEYSGAPLYGNTPPQDSVVSGNINSAPFSTYLHIHDAAAATSNSVANANWNSNTASDRFTFLGDAFCTLAMQNVIFTFFWIAEGDTDAYGEVYYRIDGGPWIKTGQPKYNNQSKWKYEIIQDPAFNNVTNLQLGFRWVNPASGVSSNVSFGIDDIIAVGTYDNINNPVELNINLISPTTVCQDNYITIGYDLSAPLCDGTYRIQMSDATGNFANPFDGGVFSIFAPDTFGFIGFQVPDNVAGTCFRIRINRISPEPQIIGDTSICFTIQDCPETIFTNNAPVMNDVDTTCIQSVIDVKFNSFGVFGPGNRNNTYTAQLSDMNGSFATPYTLGTLPSDESFPGMPGTVSGVIPANVPPGCGYFIRVVSNFPSIVGSLIGPFCLTQCDELTNNIQDIHVCLNGSTTYPNDANLVIDINHWNNDASYDTCNDWTIELRSMMDFSLVNSGGIGVYHDSVGGNFVIDFPPYSNQLPVAPGAYYMRIVSDCSNLPWNQTGSVIRITIGAPDTSRPVIILDDTVHCNLGLVSLFVSPFKHPPSDYEWAASGLNNGNAFIWPYNPLLVDFTGAILDDYIFYVREINFGCVGAYSDRAELTIIGLPSVNITGPVQVCLGDTVTYDVDYLKETYYNWDAPAGVTVLDEANSQVTMIFDSIGSFTISNFSLNDCGGDSGTYQVNVTTLYNVEAGADQTVCSGQPLTLHAETAELDKTFLTQDTAKQGKQGAMFDIIAHGDVTIDSIAVKVLATPQLVQAEIYGKSGTYKSFEQSPGNWGQLGSYFNFAASTSGLTVFPIPLNLNIAAGDTFGFYVTTVNAPTAVNLAYGNGNGPQGTVYKSDGVIDFVQGTVNNYPFGAFVSNARVLNIRIYYSTRAGLGFDWNTGDTTETIQFIPQQSGMYSVIVSDTSGCKNRDSVYVTVNQSPLVNAGNDTAVCNGQTAQLSGSTTGQIFNWTPEDGLVPPIVLDPVFNGTQTTEYILSVTSGVNGCEGKDTVIITVNDLPSADASPDTVLCDGSSYIIPATASATNTLWTPADNLNDATALNPVFNGSLTSTYALVVTDTNQCVSTDTITITVGATPAVDAGADVEICDDATHIMTAVSNGQVFVWSPADGLSETNILNPTFTNYGEENNTYTLTVFDAVGCTNADSVKLHVLPCNLKVPQAFTPNGDGNNDYFTVFGSLREYEIRIYNRWGEVVYSSTDPTELSNLSRGWDGTYKGKLQEVGTFVYYVTGVDFNGKELSRKGNLTLIR